jgi:YgiT-type zinc finger domain-containing protein
VGLERTRCASCGGALISRTVSRNQFQGDKLYRFDHVPALVCLQCGETWLAGAVSQQIDAIIQKSPKPRKFLKVPVYSLRQASLTGSLAGRHAAALTSANCEKT